MPRHEARSSQAARHGRENAAAFTRLASQAITHSSSLAQSVPHAYSVTQPTSQAATPSPVLLSEPLEPPVLPEVLVPLSLPPLLLATPVSAVPPSSAPVPEDEDEDEELEPAVAPVVPVLVVSPTSSPGGSSSPQADARAPSKRIAEARPSLMAVYDSAEATMSTRARRRLARAASMVGIAAAAACSGTSPSDGDGSSTGSASASTSSTGLADSSDGASTTAGEDGWQSSLEVGTEVGAFFSVWGPSPTLVYAAAGQPLEGGLSQGALQRWDGTQWSAETLPADTPGLNWVFGVGERRVLVGELGLILTRDGDEGEWMRSSCDTILPLWGAWGAAPDDLWAVGGDGFNRDPIACHFDGEAWTQATLPEPSFETHALFKVWGTASDDVWAVGDEGLLMHYTGEAEGWSEVPSGTDFDLISLWGTGPDEILAVGGRTTAVVSRYDGTSWTTQEVPELLGLNGVWMAADGTATVVGPFGGAGVVEPGALEVQVEDSGTILALHGTFGFDGIERWAVGGSLDMAPPYVGVVLRR